MPLLRSRNNEENKKDHGKLERCCDRAQKKVNYVHLPSNWCTTDVSNIYE